MHLAENRGAGLGLPSSKAGACAPSLRCFFQPPWPLAPLEVDLFWGVCCVGPRMVGGTLEPRWGAVHVPAGQWALCVLLGDAAVRSGASTHPSRLFPAAPSYPWASAAGRSVYLCTGQSRGFSQERGKTMFSPSVASLMTLERKKENPTRQRQGTQELLSNLLDHFWGRCPECSSEGAGALHTCP